MAVELGAPENETDKRMRKVAKGNSRLDLRGSTATLKV
jgi:hypothetical protein